MPTLNHFINTINIGICENRSWENYDHLGWLAGTGEAGRISSSSSATSVFALGESGLGLDKLRFESGSELS
jgi:hypothetical protein